MHLGEHVVSPAVYKASHKPHHRWLNPRLFDAFNGSTGDTVCMILLPLYLTANLVHCNVWSYMAFGTIYANYLTVIHSEFSYPWDPYVVAESGMWIDVGRTKFRAIAVTSRVPALTTSL